MSIKIIRQALKMSPRNENIIRGQKQCKQRQKIAKDVAKKDIATGCRQTRKRDNIKRQMKKAKLNILRK